jgi:PmbA protein
VAEGRPDLLALAEQVAGWAGTGEEVEAYVARSRATDVRAYDGQVEQLSSAETEGVGIRVVAGGRQGFAYAGSLDEAVVRETLAEARDNAAFGTVDEFLALPVPDGVPAVALDLYRPEMATTPTEQKVALALELERAVRAADPRVRGVEEADYGDEEREAAVASSTGVRATWRRTACSLFAYAIAGEGDDTHTGFGVSVGRRPDDLDVGQVAADAALRATRLLGASQPRSRRLAVVLDPWVTAQFLGVLSAALNGEAVLKGRSMFADRVGEVVAVPGVQLVDDPTVPEAFTASPYDAEGLASRRTALVEDGVLRGFLHNTYTGRRSGAGSTASAVRGGFKSTPGVGARALALAPGHQSPEEVLALVGDGLYVQSVSGMHSGANPVSGDFSVGAEGLLIRDGALAEPVREVTVASTLPRMLKGVLAVGDDLQWLPGAVAGLTLALADLTLSGT